MPKNTIADLDTTAANNTDILGQNSAGSASANTIDTLFQNENAVLARYYGDEGGLGTIGGSANAITVTSRSTYQSLTTGLHIRIKPASSSTSTVTLNLDGLGAKAVRLPGDVALSAGELRANGYYDLNYDTALNGGAGAWTLLNPSPVASNGLLIAGNTFTNTAIGSHSNLGLLSSVTSNALTVALKGADGNDPSATNPVHLVFRNATLTTGTPTILSVTAATSITISSGSTVGTSNSTPFRLWLVAFNDAGTVRLGLVNCFSANSIMTLRSGLRASSTAEGGAGAADSAQVIYTGTAVSSKDYIVLGYVDYSSGLATAGTYGTAPTTTQIVYPGMPLPGDVIQVRRNDTGAFTSGTTIIPNDDTIPQNTEGTQFMSQAITPVATANILRVTVVGNYAHSVGGQMGQALFQDSGANAIAASIGRATSNNDTVVLTTGYMARAATTSSTTFNVRAGCNNAGTTSFNGVNLARLYGGVMDSFIQIEEIVG